MTARSKVFISVAAAAAVITAANLGVILLFAWSGISRASGSEISAIGMSALKYAFPFRY